MGKQPIEIKEPPSIKEVEKFCKKIWSNEKEAEWFRTEEKRTKETIGIGRHRIKRSIIFTEDIAKMEIPKT